MACLHPVKIKNRNGEYMDVPCGRCYGCLNKKRVTLTTLTKLEGMKHKFIMFITLTYAPEYLPTCTAKFHRGRDGKHSLRIRYTSPRMIKYYQTDLVNINKRLEEAKLPYVSLEAQARIDNIIQDTALKYQKTLSESTNRAYTRKMMEKAEQDIKESIARTLMTNKQAFNIPMLTQKQADRMAEIYVDNASLQNYLLGRDASIKMSGDASFFGDLGRGAEYWLDKVRLFR